MCTPAPIRVPCVDHDIRIDNAVGADTDIVRGDPRPRVHPGRGIDVCRRRRPIEVRLRHQELLEVKKREARLRDSGQSVDRRERRGQLGCAQDGSTSARVARGGHKTPIFDEQELVGKLVKQKAEIAKLGIADHA